MDRAEPAFAERLDAVGDIFVDRSQIPLSVYVHLPWCVRKCPYCDFNSHQAPATLPEDAYVDALLADWADTRPSDPRVIDSVFFGGGTPSLFAPRNIERILLALDTGPGLARDCEITLEANPGTTERHRFSDLRAAGVNRISLGLQSLDDGALRRLGRIHGADEARRALADVKAAGFDAINCDLMFGLPGQDANAARLDIEQMLSLDPGHISYYQLTLEPGTPFHRQPPARAGDDAIQDMFETSAALLERAGYRQYEVSAWGQDHRCRHNENYWRFGDYLAIGAGAHSKRTTSDGRILRESRMRWPTGYMQAAPAGKAVTDSHTLSVVDTRFECLLNGLRLREGVSRADYEQRTGLSWVDLVGLLAGPQARGLLDIDDRHVAASSRGWYFLDEILVDLLPEASSDA